MDRSFGTAARGPGGPAAVTWPGGAHRLFRAATVSPHSRFPRAEREVVVGARLSDPKRRPLLLLCEPGGGMRSVVAWALGQLGTKALDLSRDEDTHAAFKRVTDMNSTEALVLVNLDRSTLAQEIAARIAAAADPLPETGIAPVFVHVDDPEALHYESDGPASALARVSDVYRPPLFDRSELAGLWRTGTGEAPGERSHQIATRALWWTGGHPLVAQLYYSELRQRLAQGMTLLEATEDAGEWLADRPPPQAQRWQARLADALRDRPALLDIASVFVDGGTLRVEDTPDVASILFLGGWLTLMPDREAGCEPDDQPRYAMAESQRSWALGIVHRARRDQGLP